MCSKINSKAPENGLLIGSHLYHLVKSLDDFIFDEIEGYSIVPVSNIMRNCDR